MERIDDEPIRFYYEHRELIEEWAALAKPARELIKVIVGDIADRVETEAPTEVEVLAGDDGGYAVAAYWRPHWAGPDGRPRLAVGLGWAPSRLSLHAAGGERPWVGVWRGPGANNADPYITQLRQEIGDLRKGYNTGWPWWPLYRYVDPPLGAFWDDLTPWNQAVLDSVRIAWDTFQSLVEHTILAVGGPEDT